MECNESKPNRLFDGETFSKCISDIECNEMENYHIFNHFDERGDLSLIPECRSTSAADMPGFTCGDDPTLRTGTKVVVNGVPHSGSWKNWDPREMRILKKTHYEEVKRKLKICPETEETCENIEEFTDGCEATRDENNVVVFEDAFNRDECEPDEDHINGTTGWIEEKTIYVGYNDLIVNMMGESAVASIHKTYEVSCQINKMGDVTSDVRIERKTFNGTVSDDLGTDFTINKYFGTEDDRKLLNDTEVIPFSPNTKKDELFHFQISSNHADEYVHLEKCTVSYEGKSTTTESEYQFITDGCVDDDFQLLFFNKDRSDGTQNEDWFSMRPLTINDDCKSKWIVDCTVASCKRGLEKANVKAYNEFCKAGECDRYKASFFGVNARKRRSSDDSAETSPAEAHVHTTFVHPCFYVDEENPKRCFNEDVCWTLEDCTTHFPNSYSLNSNIDELMMKIRVEVQKHIDEALATTENPDITHEQIMESIRDIANRFIYNDEDYDDAIDELKNLIPTL